MGKQSARIFYQGEDHCDVAFMDKNGYPHNHSKIYKGSKLLWKREKPKYLFLYSDRASTDDMLSAICTSDALQTLSAFISCPDNMRYANTVTDPTAPFGAFLDVEYIFDKYFAILRVGTRINSGSVFDNKYYVCCSDDGYEWKKIQSITFDEGNAPIALKRYVYGTSEVLVIINQTNIMFMDSGYNHRTVFNFPKTISGVFRNRAKKGVLIIDCYILYIVAHGENFTIRTFDTTDGYKYSFDNISNFSKDGTIYALKADGGYYNVLRSSDGDDWTSVKSIRVFPGDRYEGRTNIGIISVIDSYLYILSIYEEKDSTVYTGRHPYIIRINLQTGAIQEKLMGIDFGNGSYHYFVINGTIFLKQTERGEVYYIKWKDIFGEEPEETARITCQFNSPASFYSLLNIVSSDHNADITVW